MEKLKDKIIFYGNDLIPLNINCRGCHHFNYECLGSVVEEGCQINTLSDKDQKDNKKIISLWKDLDYNNALMYLIIFKDRKELKRHMQGLYDKISDKFRENNITLSTELFLDLMEDEDNEILNNLKKGSRYIKANLNTLRDIEKALKYSDEELDNLIKKYSL